MVRVKICGITNREDALSAVMLGADAIGFIFAESPRQIKPDKAREIIGLIPSLVQTVGVFVNDTVNFMKDMKRFCGFDIFQLHGEEGPETLLGLGGRVIKTIPLVKNFEEITMEYPMAQLLFEAPKERQSSEGGFDWSIVKSIARRRPIIIAGGLTTENIEEAIRSANPFGVDVSRGVEISPGKKDHGKMEQFILKAKGISGSPG